jgi:pimeloyl-ACP methyl ester carboxylesterase
VQRVGSPAVLKAFDAGAHGRLFGVVHGSADAAASVLALHGWRRTSSDFDKVLSGLSGLSGLSLGAVALDLPGFGASPEPPSAWGSADYAVAVAAALPAFADGPVVVLGHSFGGRVAVQLAAARPELVRGLVLTGVPLLRPPAGPAAKAALSFRAARWLHRRGVLSDERMESLRRKHGSADYRAATGVMRDVFVRVVNESYEAQLQAVAGAGCPVELVWGDDDTEARLDVAQSAMALLGPRAVLTVVPDAGHMTPLSAPDALRAAVERQL